MIKGFDAAVADLEVGAEVDIHLLPAEAYGELIRRLSSPCRLPNCLVLKT